MDRYGALVLRVCRAVLGPVDADDAWSETFLAALAAYPRLDDGANVEAWLVTIAHRKAIDVTRAAARRARPVGTVEDWVTNTVCAERADGRDSDMSRDLWAALASLPRRQREAVAYHHLAGLPYRDVAAITGGTAEAARRAAADGVAALRREFAASQGESR